VWDDDDGKCGTARTGKCATECDKKQEVKMRGWKMAQ